MSAQPLPRSRFEKVVVVTRKTQLEELIARFNSIGQARFYLEHAGEEFAPIEAAHARYLATLEGVRTLIPRNLKQQVIERAFLPQFTFGEHDLIIALGPDGLVVNIAKYLDGQPILAVNPDPQYIEGVLLPFTAKQAGSALSAALYGKFVVKSISMAQATLNDGQTLLGFNDLFIGARSHVSARYRLQIGDSAEEQSSSGIIVSTGAGSTGWLKSIYAGATKVIEALGGTVQPPKDGGRFAWEANWLVYTVREPWPSKSTGASLVYGIITPEQPLMLSSRMADNGVIFSDGIEADYLGFNAGAIATIGLAERQAKLITHH